MAATTRGNHQVQAAREQRRRRGQAEVQAWRVTETLPGTFRVVTGNGDYAVWYYQGPNRWACSCPDYAEPFGAAHKLCIECKHIWGVQTCDFMVHPDKKIPLSLLGQSEGDDTLPQQTSHDYDKENIMTERYLITRIKKGQTTTGKTVIELYSKKLQHPVLRLFELDDLNAVGLDHNELDGKEQHVKFWAYYETSDKANGEGNPYLDVLYLEPLTPVVPAPGDAPPSAILEALEALTGEVYALKALLLRFTGEQAPPQAAPPAPSVSDNGSGKASDEQLSRVKELLKALRYGDDPTAQDAALVRARLSKLGDMTATQAQEVIERLQSAQANAQAARAAAGNNGRG